MARKRRRKKGKAKKLFKRFLRSIPTLMEHLPTLVMGWPLVKVEIKRALKEAEHSAEENAILMGYWDAADAIWRKLKNDVE